MIELRHNAAIFKILPETIAKVEEGIKKAEKPYKHKLTKEKRKFPKFTQGMSTEKYMREYAGLNKPKFTQGMSTEKYMREYAGLNKNRPIVCTTTILATDCVNADTLSRPAPDIDHTIPEVIGELSGGL